MLQEDKLSAQWRKDTAEDQAWKTDSMKQDRESDKEDSDSDDSHTSAL